MSLRRLKSLIRCVAFDTEPFFRDGIIRHVFIGALANSAPRNGRVIGVTKIIFLRSKLLHLFMQPFIIRMISIPESFRFTYYLLFIKNLMYFRGLNELQESSHLISRFSQARILNSNGPLIFNFQINFLYSAIK